MNPRVEEAVASFRTADTAGTLRAIVERELGVTRAVYERETTGSLSQAEVAALQAIRVIFEGGGDD